MSSVVESRTGRKPPCGQAKEIILTMDSINKSFSGVKVLRDIHLDLYKGEVHALMGENGAGKSTLMKIMAGIYRPDSGKIIYQGQEMVWHSPLEARGKGISVIHQEISLSPNLTIGENILMGTKFPKNSWGLIQWDAIHKQAKIVLESIGSTLNPRTKVSDLSVAQQQIVEIARALSFNSEVLIMDEPTASLTDKEIDKLFVIINDLRKRGVAIVYISHRMDEIFKISDRCTVLRDGQWISSHPIAETNPEQLVKQMVGRELNDLFQKTFTPLDSSVREPVLELINVSDNGFVDKVSLKIYPGEILGLAGLVGAGRTELFRTIFGIRKMTSGEIRLNGSPVTIKSPIEAMELGIAHVPESRKEQGLFPNLSVKENIIMNQMHTYRKAGVLRYESMNPEIDKYIKNLGVRLASPEQNVMGLSGGNQQKVVIARWLSIGPKVLLLDEPTRGVDVGAKTEIHKIICQLAEKGLAVLMVSSELPEILAVSDRVLVMHEGKLKAELSREEATQEKIMYFATGEIKK
ncbi:sugar ABC transporter ATP-binding protein [Paenibacillus sp. BR2-3]|uniref:sugar ABC transporter ATP-binding protein n=1 Tax=Paenibacillus sp. BR2-3 TaxID=3048494 RepID=UPI003977896E